MRDPVKIVHPSGRELTVSRSRVRALSSAGWELADETPKKTKAAPVSDKTSDDATSATKTSTES